MLQILQRLCLATALLALAGCYQMGQPVAGVADAQPWFSLNLDKLLHEGDAQPVALSFCADAQCPKKLVVGLIVVSGDSVRPLENLLRNPSRLTAEMNRREREPTLKRAAKAGSKQHVETVTTIAPLRHDPVEGFTVAMSRQDGKGRINATVLGWRDGDNLKVVIAIGDDAEAATDAAGRAVERHAQNVTIPGK